MFSNQFILVALVLVHLVSGSPYKLLKSEIDLLSTRIVGGQPAPDNYAHHMVALLIGARPWTIMVCGGSIVSTKHVLTAAHCIDAVVVWHDTSQLADSLRGVIGSNNHTSTENMITFKSYINHPNWNSRTIKNDIGLLFTSKEIVLTSRIAVINLKKDWVNGGEKCYVTGWGNNGNFVVPDLLQLLYLPTLDGQECIDRMAAKAALLGITPPPVDPRIEICTLHSIGFGMCNGDSGSALVSMKTREQAGIVSWGLPCAHGAPDVFVRVSSYLKDFIQPILGG